MEDPEVSVYDLEAITKGLGVTDDLMAARIKKLRDEALRDIADNARDEPKDMAYKYYTLRRIIAYMYQIAAAHECPEHILDVLSDPEGATEEQISAMLPYRL